MQLDAAPPRVEWIVLTASSRRHARTAMRQLRQRRDHPLLARAHGVLVVPDPGGHRVGSGAATIGALRAVARRILRRLRQQQRPDTVLPTSIDDVLRNRRILVLHCGGDARRMPPYAAIGKIFVPLPPDLRPPDAPSSQSTLFEAALGDLAGPAFPAGGAIRIGSGDVILGLGTRHHIEVDDADITLVAVPGDAHQATRHGVYDADEDGVLRATLQKPSLKELTAHFPNDKRIPLDSGVVSLRPAVAARWLDACGVSLENGGVHTHGWMANVDNGEHVCDLYADIIPSLVTRTASADDGLDWRGDACVRVRHADYGHLMHLGTTRELLSRPQERRTVLQTDGVENIIGPVEASAWIEGSHPDVSVRFEGDGILVGLPGECHVPISIPANFGMVCVPIRRGAWTAVGFSIDDPSATFESCWWKCGELDDVVSHAVSVIGEMSTGPRPKAATPDGLISARDLPDLVDHARWEQLRRGVRAVAPAHTPPAVDADPLRRAMDIARRARRLSGDDAAAVAARNQMQSESRRLVADAVMQAQTPTMSAMIPVATDSDGLPHWRRDIDEPVLAEAPVRLDLAGGWSDTPPVTQLVGGHVINVSMRLAGVLPVRATAQRIREPHIEIMSIDLGRMRTITRSRDLAPPFARGAWDALACVALRQSGLVPEDAERDSDLAPLLARQGGGLRIAMHSMVPKGSGLGTSSMLAAVISAALDGLTTDVVDHERICSRVTHVEQELGSAGGWQDQFGGVLGGFKSMHAKAGSQTIVAAEQVDVPTAFADAWRERAVLVFSGRQRMASSILHGIIQRVLCEDADVMSQLTAIRSHATVALAAIRDGDFDAFVHAHHAYGQQKRAIDPGSVVPEIDAAVSDCGADIAGWSLPGAGGGGFILAFARDADAASRIRHILTNGEAGRPCRGFAASVDDHGLRVTVL